MEKSGTKSKSKRRIISLELKKEIISWYENGAHLMDLSKQYDMPRTTIATIIKNKDIIKEADVAKGVSILTKSRPQSVEEMEKLLLIWINEKQVAGDSISESLICEKALRLHADIIARSPGAKRTEKERGGTPFLGTVKGPENNPDTSLQICMWMA
ncbi:hypothetical protein JRQ81_002879 [Phrynocephalus forsythii]|uniref:HTH psq-type domain-containing protein n=1 Tax=Phrynocephalus forsythii TaxID=171643 RepID=A0A9Q0XJ56_9SAUR|nr:hypothetical protein JRQ81_002879 [Phrynocephalus forsythii]